MSADWGTPTEASHFDISRARGPDEVEIFHRAFVVGQALLHLLRPALGQNSRYGERASTDAIDPKAAAGRGSSS